LIECSLKTDVLLFGVLRAAIEYSAPTRNSELEDGTTRESDTILYKAEDIASNRKLGFSPAYFIFIALVCGGDYAVSRARFFCFELLRN
jgi:hypothetical protein